MTLGCRRTRTRDKGNVRDRPRSGCMVRKVATITFDDGTVLSFKWRLGPNGLAMVLGNGVDKYEIPFEAWDSICQMALTTVLEMAPKIVSQAQDQKKGYDIMFR